MERRMQFSLKRLFVATFWAALAVACVLTNRGLADFEGPRLLRRAIALTTFLAAIPAACIAVGILLGSAKTGATVGLLDLSAIVMVAYVQGLYEIGLNSIDSNELIYGVAFSVIGLVAGTWMFVRRNRSRDNS